MCFGVLSSKRARAAVSIAGAMSAPITRPAGATMDIASNAASPGPVATSSTRSPLATAAAANTAGTNSRDHRPKYCSYAEASTGRPAAAWRPEPKCRRTGALRLSGVSRRRSSLWAKPFRILQRTVFPQKASIRIRAWLRDGRGPYPQAPTALRPAREDISRTLTAKNPPARAQSRPAHG